MPAALPLQSLTPYPLQYPRADAVENLPVEKNMSKSLNVRFESPKSQPATDEAHPGHDILVEIAAALNQKGWTTTEPDDWRDVGWQLRCRREAAELIVVIASTGEPGQFLAQVSPAHGTGSLGRLLGRQTSASVDDCVAVATLIHQVLTERGCSGIGWRWDGTPKPGSSSAEPHLPP
jgi:hypothetical protein